MNLKRIKKGNSQLLTKENGTTILISYSTAVACFIPGEGFSRTAKKHSSTTSKHINQWLRSEHAEDRVTVKPQEYFDALC